MTNKSGLYFTSGIKDELSRRRLISQRIKKEHLARIASEYPEIDAMIDELNDIRFELSLKIIESEGNASEMEAPARAIMDGKAEEIKKKLVEAGLPADYLEERPVCPICRDTGINGGEMCSCVKNLVVSEMFKGSGLTRGQTFETFRHDLIDDPRESGAFERKYKYCLDYAEKFPNNDPRDILLIGTPGVGKSFMLNCIGERVLSRGYSVLRVTANRLVENIVDSFKSDESAPNYFVPDLLIIDDLGTEPMYRNVTVENILSTVCDRQDSGRATLIATNKSPEDINKSYGERLASRLLSPACVKVIKMTNPSLRMNKALR